MITPRIQQNVSSCKKWARSRRSSMTTRFQKHFKLVLEPQKAAQWTLVFISARPLSQGWKNGSMDALIEEPTLIHLRWWTRLQKVLQQLHERTSHSKALTRHCWETNHRDQTKRIGMSLHFSLREHNLENQNSRTSKDTPNLQISSLLDRKYRKI